MINLLRGLINLPKNLLNWIKPKKTLAQQMGESIYHHLICPACKDENNLYLTAEGGAAQNIECHTCKTLFWGWAAPDGYAEAKIIRDSDGKAVDVD